MTHFLINTVAKGKFVTFYVNRSSTILNINEVLDMRLNAVGWNPISCITSTDYFLLTNDEGEVFRHKIKFTEKNESINTSHKKVYKHSAPLKDIAVFN